MSWGRLLVSRINQMHYENDFEKNHILANIVKYIPRPKNKAALEKMKKSLLKYVLFTTKAAIGQCNRVVRSK